MKVTVIKVIKAVVQSRVEQLLRPEGLETKQE